MSTLSSHHHFGPYALLTSARRAAAHQQPEHVCGWCLEKGTGTLIYINARLVLSTHADCVVSAEVESLGELCVCLDSIHPGDTPACPVHGGAKC